MEHFAVRIPNLYLLETSEPLPRKKEASSNACVSVTFSISSWEGVEVYSLNGSGLEAHCHREKRLWSSIWPAGVGFVLSGWYD